MGDIEFDRAQLKAATTAALRARAKTKGVQSLCSSLVVEHNEGLISLFAELRELEWPAHPREKCAMSIDYQLVVVVHSNRAVHNVSPEHIEAHATTYTFPHGATATLESVSRPVQVRLTDDDGRSLVLEFRGPRRSKRWYVVRPAGFKPTSGRHAGERWHGHGPNRSVER